MHTANAGNTPVAADSDVSTVHVSVNGNPNVIFISGAGKEQFLGVSVLPELEYCKDLKCGNDMSIYASLFWAGSTSLVSATNVSGSSNVSTPAVQVSDTKQTNWAVAVGLEWKPTSSSLKATPAIQALDIGIGYANFDVGSGNYQNGLMFTFGFKVKAVSFNFK